MPEPTIYTVSALTSAIRGLLEEAIGELWVEGEISNLRRQASGHVYFTLKDAGAQLSCVMFRAASQSAGGRHLVDGQSAQLLGQISVYEARGQYQLIVHLAQPRGRGALQAKFEALKARLAAEGLFDRARKKALPRFPRAIGLLTSPTGAALQDMLNVFTRRAPWVRLLVHPVRVQGAGAAAEIARAVMEFDRWAAGPNPALRVEVVIVARGGGSLEDLWEFNEEIVARAIAASTLPVVSAVGHEIDFTIADFAADLRAPTPSAAAELLVPDTAELLARLGAQREVLRRVLSNWAVRARERLDVLARGELLRAPRRRLEEEQQRLDALAEALARAMRGALDEPRLRLARLAAALRPEVLRARAEAARQAITALQARLRAATEQRVGEQHRQLLAWNDLLRVLGPQATLERGYSITTDASGGPLSSIRSVSSGERVRTQLADGEILSDVAKVCPRESQSL